ncbi:phage tail length tape-measure protein [Bacillus sp. JCM 19045]|nr:phage tail length tape-measure protein [Bacillus sp. JCM 19045]
MADGTIKIAIEVDGKQIAIASKELDNLKASAENSGKGIKSAENSLSGLSDKSGDAGKNVKGAGDAIEGLGESGGKASKGLNGAEGAIDGLSDSSSDASSNVKGASDALSDLSDSGSQSAKNVNGASGAIDGLSDSGSDAATSIKNTSDSVASLGDDAGNASKATGNLKTSLGLAAVAGTALAVVNQVLNSALVTVRASLDDAIARFDTLNAFPKVLEALGVSAEDSQRAMGNLSDGIDGLPTKLNDIAASAQRMYTSFGDIDMATDSAIALNNALLGSGASAGQAQRGTEQYIKALQTGTFDMNTWNTLSETMDVGLVKIAESFGFAGKSAKDDLYSALKDGTITIDDFNNKLIEVGTGTGIMATLAKENSLGVATSFSNLQTSVSRGVANSIAAIDNLSKSVTGNNIAENIDGMKDIVNAAFKIINSSIDSATPYLVGLKNAVKPVVPIIQTLSPVIIGLASSFAILTGAAIAKTLALKTYSLIAGTATAVTSAYTGSITVSTIATNAMTASLYVMSTAKKAVTAMTNAATAAALLFTGQISFSTVAIIAKTVAVKALDVAIKFLLGPIGLVIAGVGLLVGAVIAVVGWLNKATEEGERLGAETEELASKTDALNDSLDSTSAAYEKNQSSIIANADATEELASKVDELANKENKSAAEKELLASYINELNSSMDGLNLMYSEEAEALNMSSEQMAARIELLNEQDKAQEAQSRLTEILREQSEVEQQLAETNELRDEWNQKLEEGSVKAKEHKEAMGELDDQHELLIESQKNLGEQYETTEQQLTDAITAVTELLNKAQRARSLLLKSYRTASNQQLKA